MNTLDKKIEEILDNEIEHEMGSNGNAVKRLSLLLQQTCREVIGEDEPIELNDQDWYEYGKTRCNDLRAEQRARLAALVKEGR